ncbi:MAG: PH domain-containing protein [Clostridium sp.]|nr:MAG: PH domain-containing protein [Clostridium sp.]
MSYVDGILQKDEEVVAKAKVTKLVLIGAWIKGILLCCLFFIPTIKAIVLTIVVSKIELALTNQRLVGRVGVIRRQIMDSKLDKIQTVQIRETFWGRIFGFANIAVSTAGTAKNEYVYFCYSKSSRI